MMTHRKIHSQDGAYSLIQADTVMRGAWMSQYLIHLQDFLLRSLRQFSAPVLCDYSCTIPFKVTPDNIGMFVTIDIYLKFRANNKCTLI
jgi:hypothetical protein